MSDCGIATGFDPTDRLGTARSSWLVLLCVSLNAVGACSVEERSEQVGTLAQSITDRVPDTGHPAVGWLTVSGHAGGSTATLVGPRAVISAAHAVLPGARHTFHLDSGDYEIVSVKRHPQWNQQTNENDISVLTLATV